MDTQNTSAVPAAGEAAYTAKPGQYFAGVRTDFLDLLEPISSAANGKPVRALEVGCGFGETGRAALERGLATVYAGCELQAQAAAQAASCLTEVLPGDIETMDLPWPAEHFDAVLISEVLEHLKDPWSVVDRLWRLMKPGAVILASSPNVSHHRIIRELCRGRFEYADVGPMDRTHLRWFTPASYARMFEQAGFQTEQVGPMTAPGTKTKLMRTVTLGLLPASMFMRQIRYVGRKPQGPPPTGPAARQD